MPVLLVLGAVVQPYSIRPGRWLTWVGASFLSVTILPAAAVLPLGDALAPHGVLGRFFFPLWIASLILIVWCDAALITDAIKIRGRADPSRRPPGVGEWLVWSVAVFLSLWVLWVGVSVSPALYRRVGSQYFPSLLYVGICLAWVLIVVSFDIALVIDALGRLRSRLPATDSGYLRP